MTKRCPRCKLTKPRDQFYKDRSVNGGLSNYCKTCKGWYVQQWVANNPEKVAEYQSRRPEDPAVTQRRVAREAAKRKREDRLKRAAYGIKTSAPKLCPGCGESKPCYEFLKKQANYDGLDARCKVCRNFEKMSGFRCGFAGNGTS